MFHNHYRSTTRTISHQLKAPQNSIGRHIRVQIQAPAPRVNPKKGTNQESVGRRTRLQCQTSDQPIAKRTQSKTNQTLTVTPAQAAHRKFPRDLLALWCTQETSLDHMALPVLNPDTGQTMEYRQLRRHPKYKQLWENSYCNELGRLCQSIRKGFQGLKNQRVAGTETFKVRKYQESPQDRRKEVCHTKVVCEVQPHKEDPDRTRIPIGGNHIIYPGDVGTPTASLELIKLILNSVLSRPVAKFACFDVKYFYLATPMDRSEYARIKIEYIPEEFIKEYNLLPMVHNGWIYFKIVRGCYGLTQSGMLANNLLLTHINKNGYFEATTTPGI